jgi:hypothetical protein
MKLSSDCGVSGSKKYKRGYGEVWREFGDWIQAAGFALVRVGAITIVLVYLNGTYTNFINPALSV